MTLQFTQKEKNKFEREMKLYQFSIQGMQNLFLLQFVHLTTLPLSFLWHWWHI